MFHVWIVGSHKYLSAGEADRAAEAMARITGKSVVIGVLSVDERQAKTVRRCRVPSQPRPVRYARRK